jgi:hypothetical protein
MAEITGDSPFINATENQHSDTGDGKYNRNWQRQMLFLMFRLSHLSHVQNVAGRQVSRPTLTPTLLCIPLTKRLTQST